nr:penicillin-binding transpeptidase domain-containing protein [Bradyrhizobium aeschynomenes]
MCEALMVSSNLFFGGVAERLTRNAAHDESDPLGLEKMARQLSFDHQPCRDAAGNVIIKDGSPQPCGFNLLRSAELRPQKLRASPVRLDLRTYEDAVADLQTLLRTGWGDGADATPLAMASIYASLGRRQLVRPTLRQVSRRPDGCPTEPEQNECEPLLSDWSSASPLFENLRMGLHAVSGPPSGSARAAFAGADALRLMPDGKPRLFVKTGTATYRAVNDDTGKVATYFTLWLAGWIEGVEGTPISNRLAFACVVTRGTGNDTGGGICAPLVRQFLEALNRRAQKG